MDANFIGEDVHQINVLTVVASESYDNFAKALQSELAEVVSDRPKIINSDLFNGKVIRDFNGIEQTIDYALAQTIYEGLIINGYARKGILTEKYYDDKKSGTLSFAEEVKSFENSIISIIDIIYDAKACEAENARSVNVELKIDKDKLGCREFNELWKRINVKSAYIVDFETEELVKKAIAALDEYLRVSQIYFNVESGSMEEIKSKEELEAGASFVRQKGRKETLHITASSTITYDLIGKIVEGTGLTRATVAKILAGINTTVFDQFKNNPEEFIIKASDLINEQKATVIIQHITYNKLESSYDMSVFTEPSLKGKLGYNAMPAQKHLYDHILYDSTNERNFAEKLDTCDEVSVYVKLPSGFYIQTPVGKYNPDWAIAFHDGHVKHIYFVAETKGSLSSMELRKIEEAKIQCAKEHFKAISTDKVEYEVVDNYETLMKLVM